MASIVWGGYGMAGAFCFVYLHTCFVCIGRLGNTRWEVRRYGGNQDIIGPGV